MNISPHVIWFIAGLVLILLEFASPGIIIIFFGIGAWIVSLTSYLGITGSIESQVALFGISSVALIVFLRKYVRGKFYGHISDEQDITINMDEYAGKNVIVLSDIVPGKKIGAVEFNGTRWNATSEQKINTGELAIVVKLDGLKLIVKKKES